MRIQRLRLNNFRQFRDDTIDFAQGGDQNVTVIHGANGSGKTTILNAFKWVMYNEVEFKNHPERLATEGAMADANVNESVTVAVTLDFEHEGAEYSATRTAVYRKRNQNDIDGEFDDGEITVSITEGGRTRQAGNPGNVLSRVVPERLSELFFFDGEDIDELSQIDNQDQIQEAIENIMGLTILERAERHLDDAAGRFEDEVAEYGTDELEELIDQKREIEEEIEQLTIKHQDKVRAEERVDREITDIEQTLAQFEDSERLQNQRDEYKTRIDDLKKEIEGIDEQIRDQISQNGFVALGLPLIRDTAEDIDELRQEGEIPSGLSNQYLNSLLEASECICGRPLESGSEPYNKVAAMKSDVSTDGVDQAALRLIGNLEQLSDKRSEFLQEVDELVELRYKKREEIERLQERIDEIQSELQDIETTTDNGQSVAELEQTREEKKVEKDQLLKEIGSIENKIEAKEDRIAALEEEIDEKQDEQEEALLAKRRQRAAELVGEEIAASYEELKDKVRRWSNKRVRQTFDGMVRKDFTAHITDDFELKIRKEIKNQGEVDVGISTGERQIASLAFIGSLVKIARNRYESDSESEYFQGGVYPIVMDSPFGKLDKDHRREVSRVIPTLGSQVVVLATDSQWEGPVEREMADRIGQQYWLDYDAGDGRNEHPRTRVKTERTRAAGD